MGRFLEVLIREPRFPAACAAASGTTSADKDKAAPGICHPPLMNQLWGVGTLVRGLEGEGRAPGSWPGSSVLFVCAPIEETGLLSALPLPGS